MYGGGGANKPLTNSLKTLPKNSNPKTLSKNPKKIQDSKTISKIGISIIASVLLSQNLAALPAGGKFIHGSGSISKNNGTMTITGNNKNHVIAWGGGFNINNGETVNFKGSGKAFLNLDYSNKASKILGTLNGGGNNIYLVNPSGVLIGENGKVNNVSRFVASTSSLDKALTQFVNAAKQNGDQNAVNFSPVFTRGSLKGNVINMGTINASNIVLVGNEVRNLTSNGTKDVQGTINNGGGTDSLHIIGNKIFLDVEGVQNKKNIWLTGTSDVLGPTPQITVQMAMSTFKANGHNDWIRKTYSIDGVQSGGGSWDVHRIITIGSVEGWNNFANAWNGNGGNSGLGITRQIEEFKLISNLNFSGTDFVSVGKPQGAGFNKIFNGNGYTMSNITLDNNDASNNGGITIAGVFNKVGGGTIKNLTIDTINANINASANTIYLGGFAGQINGGNINNVTLNNINLQGRMENTHATSVANDNGYVGGFAGVISNNGNISINNVVLNNIENLYLYSNQFTGSTMFVGGFAGRIANANGNSKTTINNVILNKIGILQNDVVTGMAANANIAVAGFVTELGSGNSISNASLYFDENTKFIPASVRDYNSDSRNRSKTFYYHTNGLGSSLSKINIYYNTKYTDTRYGPSADVGYNVVRINGQDRLYYTANGVINGIRNTALQGEIKDGHYGGKDVNFHYYDAVSNDMGFEGRVKAWHPNITASNYNYSWVKQERISNTYPMNSSLNTSGDYTTLIDKYLPQIIDDILKADYGVTIEDDNGQSTQDSLKNIMAELDKILNVINRGESEGSADSKITNFLNQILVGADKNNAELKESIKQSINFLRAFYEGYNGSNNNAVTKTHAGLFSGNANYTNATNKYRDSIKGGMNNLKTTINGKLADIKTLEGTLKKLADALNKAQELNNQGAQLNTQVENIKNQVEALDKSIADLDTKIAETQNMINKIPDQQYNQALKNQLAQLKQQRENALAERSRLKTQVANIIDHQIKVLKDTDLANLIKEVDGYVTTINDIRNGFINDLKINNPQDIAVMGNGAKGSFTYYGVETMAQNDIQDNINVPLPIDSIPLIPLEPSKPIDPTPDPNPDPITPPGGGDGGDGTDPDPDPITPPEGGGGDGTDPTNPTNPSDPDNGGNNGGGDNGNNGGGNNGNNGDNGDNGDNSYEGDDTVNNNSGYDARLAYLNYKREVLELPAEEETSIEINEGREKGRLCIVSDNAKTNNPCMAITY